jgi:hypothetical protein
VIESLGFFMVYRVVMDVAFLMAAGFIQSPIGQISMTSRSDPRTLLYTIHGILKIGAVVLVIWGAVYAFRIDAIARSGFETFTEGAIVFGSLSLCLFLGFCVSRDSCLSEKYYPDSDFRLEFLLQSPPFRSMPLLLWVSFWP